MDEWGTAVILERRAINYGRWLKATGYVGFILPVIIGAFVSAGASDWISFKSTVSVVGIVGAIQAIASGTLVFAGFEKKLADVLHASGVNKELAQRCELLANDMFLPPDVFRAQQAMLIGECLNQERNDERFTISQKEIRRAHRAGLLRFSLTCAACDKVPSSREANGSTCNYCGDF